MTHTTRFAGIPALAVAFLLVTGFVHNHLVKSSPAADEKLAASPQSIRLWFNERPEVPFTSVTILRADSTKLATIKAVATDDSMAVSAPLATPLGAGSYVIIWRTASRDGHAIRGSFGFSIAP
jgi:methionine-rich copper-binding protein CopC